MSKILNPHVNSHMLWMTSATGILKICVLNKTKMQHIVCENICSRQDCNQPSIKPFAEPLDKWPQQTICHASNQLWHMPSPGAHAWLSHMLSLQPRFGFLFTAKKDTMNTLCFLCNQALPIFGCSSTLQPLGLLGLLPLGSRLSDLFLGSNTLR